MDVNDLFYGNALDASSRLSDLEQFRDYIDGYLQREQEYFREEAHPDLEREFLPLFSATFPPILHSSLVVSSVMLVELEVRGFSEALREHLSLPLSMADLQGSLLDRFRKYAGLLAGLDFQPNGDQWADVVGVFEIRNCLVHSYGSLDRFSRRSVVEEFVRRHGNPNIDRDIVKVDGTTSAKVLSIASGFFDMIYEAALRRFPGRYKWPPQAGLCS
jgi:hypothetical protein